jgi:hypothetical protein
VTDSAERRTYDAGDAEFEKAGRFGNSVDPKTVTDDEPEGATGVHRKREVTATGRKRHHAHDASDSNGAAG